MNDEKRMKMARNRSQPVLLLVVLTILAACAAGPYGTLQPSTELERTFESYQVLADHTYYYSGAEAAPDAILGIKQGYNLESQLWQPVEMTEDKLRQMVSRMYEADFLVRSSPFAAYILNPAGERIGIWYSRVINTTVKLQDHQVMVNTPDIFRLRRGVGQAPRAFGTW